jgi:hypothetical protein
MSNQKVIDAVRVVGHLLETNGTTGEFAKNKQNEGTNWHDPKACRWCLMGAIYAVGPALKVDTWKIESEVRTLIPYNESTVSFWDGTTNLGRKELIHELKRYGIS